MASSESKTILVTGGAGFIGSHFVRLALRKSPTGRVIVLDALTYAGNLENLEDVQADYADRYRFVKGDIRDRKAVDELMPEVDIVVNLAAESSVDRSVEEPDRFVTTDVVGVYVLLESARLHGVERFLQMSTDEVYGSVETGASKETDPLEPRSPYSASKAGGELLAKAYFVTFGLPIVIARPSNNFGTNQYPEKVIPYFATNVIDDKPLPIYGDGRQSRDYLYVEDCCEALWLLLEKGEPGEAYNIGAGNERTTLQIARGVLSALGKPESLIRHVTDRPGHDRRYNLDDSKIRALGWRPQREFEEAFAETVKWYVDYQDWWRKIRNSQPFRELEAKWFEPRLRGKVGE
jgi:dTDP-glucose 4,6-dehydratase